MVAGEIVVAVFTSIPRSLLETGKVGGILLVFLIDQFSGNDSEYLFDAFPVLGVDLVTTVPAYVLVPKARASFGVGAVDYVVAMVAAAGSHGQRWSRSGALGIDATQLFGDICYCSLKDHLPPCGVICNHVALGADHMYYGHDIAIGAVFLHLGQPCLHFLPAILIGDIIAQQTSVGTSVV